MKYLKTSRSRRLLGIVLLVISIVVIFLDTESGFIGFLDGLLAVAGIWLIFNSFGLYSMQAKKMNKK